MHSHRDIDHPGGVEAVHGEDVGACSVAPRREPLTVECADVGVSEYLVIQLIRFSFSGDAEWRRVYLNFVHISEYRFSG